MSALPWPETPAIIVISAPVRARPFTFGCSVVMRSLNSALMGGTQDHKQSRAARGVAADAAAPQQRVALGSPYARAVKANRFGKINKN